MFPAPAGEARPRRPSLTVLSLVALAAGLLLGILGHGSDGGVRVFAEFVRPLGDLWIAALQMLAVPLMIVYTLAAIVGTRGRQAVGVLAGRAVLLFAAMLLGAALITMAVAPWVVRLYPADRATLETLAAATRVPESLRQPAGAGAASLGAWISSLVPRNVFEAAVRGDVLPLLLFTVLLGIAIARLPLEQRGPLSHILQALAEAMLVCVRWVLALTPMGVFVLTLLFALGTGHRAVGVLGAWAAISSSLLILCTVLLYPLTASLGGTRLGVFGRAVAPAQLVAATTRSSIAALPALVQSARERLGLSEAATGVVLPLGITIFKLSQIVMNLTKFFFLAHVCEVTLSAPKVAAFLLTILILSFSTAGLPSRGSVRSIPAYLAAGIPIEAVVIVDTIEAIPDIFQTVINVTGNLSAAAILSRSSRVERAVAPASGPTVAPAMSEAE